MTFDIGLHEVCVWTGVRYVITKFSGMDSLPNFLTHGAPLRAPFARAGAPLSIEYAAILSIEYEAFLKIGTNMSESFEWHSFLESVEDLCR